MPSPEKKERNKKIVKLRDQKGWTFEQIGKEFNITRITAFNVYQREKNRQLDLAVDKS